MRPPAHAGGGPVSLFFSWSQGSDVAAWPAGGEIDVIEGVNNQVSNQMALHTSDGCTLTSSTTSYTGTTNSTNCYEGANDNSGCAISDGNSDSYGADFAAGGGGVWVTELASTGISYVPQCFDASLP